MKEVVQKVYNNWQTDLNKTLPAMKQIPKIFFNDKWQITSIEKNKNIILNKLDTKSGIDWIAENENHIITIAARIQFGVNYRTFTIRKERKTGTKTELEKRKEAIKNGFLYPLYTCQCYFTNNYNFLGGAIIKTVDLYKSLENVNVFEKKSDNKFIHVSFYDLHDKGYKIKIKEGDPFLKIA